jgi:hypothetical protein
LLALVTRPRRRSPGKGDFHPEWRRRDGATDRLFQIDWNKRSTGVSMKQGMSFPPVKALGAGALAGMIFDLCGDERASVLLIGQREQGATIIESAGGRLLCHVPVGEALDTLDRLADVHLVLFDCSTPHPANLKLLARLDAMIAVNDIRLIVITDLDGLDLVFPHIGARTQLLCDPSDMDLATAVMLGLRPGPAESHFCDIGKDGDALRLERLSEEVGRLARTLDAMMEAGHQSTLHPVARAPSSWMSDRKNPYVSQTPLGAIGDAGAEGLQASHVREMLRARRLRDQFLPGELFADPAWDMMLDLMAARLSGERVSVSSLCIAAAVPPTTALRWIRQLTERGIFRREADIADGRRVFIMLSDEAASSISGWFYACHRVLRGSGLSA